MQLLLDHPFHAVGTRAFDELLYGLKVTGNEDSAETGVHKTHREVEIRVEKSHGELGEGLASTSAQFALTTPSTSLHDDVSSLVQYRMALRKALQQEGASKTSL